jgi:putative ABC transport system ATP-binding protein
VQDVILQANGLTKNFTLGSETIRALSEVSLVLRRGEILLIKGPSGSGKTTLLCLLAGILTPTHGDVEILGKRLAECSPGEVAQLRLRHFGFIFQQGVLLRSLTALENTSLPAMLASAPRGDAEERALRLLGDFGLQGRMRSLPQYLSGGERQRVAIARAMVNDPLVIFADEPTANLDADNRDMILRLLRARAKTEGRGILIVTHDERLMSIADRALLLADGKLVDGEG